MNIFKYKVCKYEMGYNEREYKFEKPLHVLNLERMIPGVFDGSEVDCPPRRNLVYSGKINGVDAIVKVRSGYPFMLGVKRQDELEKTLDIIINRLVEAGKRKRQKRRDEKKMRKS
tara:strand:+ start:435 stop:779 length:345 start_codon:yes stop_codon:yes gene_type:complete